MAKVKLSTQAPGERGIWAGNQRNMHSHVAGKSCVYLSRQTLELHELRERQSASVEIAMSIYQDIAFDYSGWRLL